MSRIFRRPYDEEANARARAKTRVCNDLPSLTVQSATTDCDINVLVKRFGIDKDPVPYLAADPSFYGDFSDLPDLATALNRVRHAEQLFNALPAQLRSYFHNDPALMWAFVNDPANADEAVRMGLLQRRMPPDEQTPPAPTRDTPAAPMVAQQGA